MAILICQYHLDLFEGESSARPDLLVVTDSRTTDLRAKRTGRGTRGDGTGFPHASQPPAGGPGRLVEPGLHEPLPVLVEVPIGHHVVALTHLEDLKSDKPD